MLKLEDTPQTQSSPAAQVRVTPEELAAAVTALQIRKEGQPGTIAIGDAVEELGLDVTPEEVLAEVQARRATNKRPRFGTRLKVLSAVLAVLVGLSIWGVSQQPTSSPSVAVQPMPTTFFIPVQGSAFQHIKVDPNLMVKNAEGKLLLLSEVGNQQQVYCFYDYDNGQLQSYSSAHDVSKENWFLIKHEGQLYVRGWIDPISNQALQRNGVDVGTWESDFVASDPSHASHVQITLPLNGFKVKAGGSDDKEFHATDVHLDKYAYEKW